MTQIIKLTRGFETVVDDQDYEELSKYNWYAQGIQGRPARRITTPKKTIIYMYHQILGVWPWNLGGLEVEHSDRNPLNNCRYNLEIVTHQKNMQNTERVLNKTGVDRDNTHDTYKAYIDRPNYNRINIGTFQTREEALKAVKNWKL